MRAGGLFGGRVLRRALAAMTVVVAGAASAPTIATTAAADTTSTTLNPTNVGGLALNWAYSANTSLMRPAAANGLIYFFDDSGLEAVDPSTHDTRWTATAPRSAIGMTAADGRLFTGGMDGMVYAVDGLTGAVQWSFRTQDYIPDAPAVADGTVYIASQDRHLYALDELTGAVRWSYSPGQTGVQGLAAGNGLVYTGSADNKVRALDAATGTVRWEFVAAAPPFPNAVENGIVYATAATNTLYALDATTGTRYWTATDAGVDGPGAPSASGRHIVTRGGVLEARDAQSGALDWSFVPPSSSPAIVSSAIVGDGVVFAATRNNAAWTGALYAFDAATGAQLWSTDTGPAAEPAVTGTALYVVSESLRAYGLNPPHTAIALRGPTHVDTTTSSTYTAKIIGPPTPAVGQVYLMDRANVLTRADLDASGSARMAVVLPPPAPTGSSRRSRATRITTLPGRRRSSSSRPRLLSRSHRSACRRRVRRTVSRSR